MIERPPSARPKTSVGRPGTAAGRPGTASNRPPSAAQRAPSARSRPQTGALHRPVTGAARPQTTMSMRVGEFFNWADPEEGSAAVEPHRRTRTAAPGGRMGSAAGGRIGSRAVQRPITVQSRPVTQQGMQGVRPMSTRAGVRNRQVQDKSYYMGLLRAHMSELNAELKRLTADARKFEEDRQHFAAYEKRAESMAAELKQMQGKLADLNTVVDRVNSNMQLHEMRDEIEQANYTCENEQASVDALFAERRDKEEQAKQLETDLENERRDNSNAMQKMDHDARQRYVQLKEKHDDYIEELQLKQNELDELTQKKSDLEDELAVSSIKQQAMSLHERLAELEARKAAIESDMATEATVGDVRQRLLEVVKQHNAEIQTMERQIAEFKERIKQCDEEMAELDQEVHDQTGEKYEKYRELRVKEQQIDEFLEPYDVNYRQEQQRIANLTQSIEKTLLLIAKNYEQQDKTAVGSGMTDFKLPERRTRQSKTLNNVDELKNTHVKMQEEIITMREQDNRAQEELETLRRKMHDMRAELSTFTDVDSVKDKAREKQQRLTVERQELAARVGEVQRRQQQMRAELQRLKQQLADNEQHQQICALEKKWTYAQQNNYAIRDALEARKAETDVAGAKGQCMQAIAAHQQYLLTRYSQSNQRHSATLRQQ